MSEISKPLIDCVWIKEEPPEPESIVKNEYLAHTFHCHGNSWDAHNSDQLTSELIIKNESDSGFVTNEYESIQKIENSNCDEQADIKKCQTNLSELEKIDEKLHKGSSLKIVEKTYSGIDLKMLRCGKQKRYNWSEAEMEAAVEKVKTKKMGVRQASKTFKVPYSTLRDRVNDRYSTKGKTTVLKRDEEDQIVSWVLKQASIGFPVTKSMLRYTVKTFLDYLKKKTVFKDNKPGRNWMERFMSRHKDIAVRHSESSMKYRASLSADCIKEWFDDINKYMETKKLNFVFSDPKRVFNLDETAVFLNPTQDLVLAKKGSKNVYTVSAGSDRECVTVLLGGNANGQLLPPLIVYKYIRLPQLISNSIPSGYVVNTTDSGWMKSETFLSYIRDDFLPWLNENFISRPIIIFLDGHRFHLSLELSEFCSANGIILAGLYPNATHILQPMDVGFFRSFKLHYRNVRDAWTMNNGVEKTFGKVDFPVVLKEAVEATLRNPNILPHSFRASGLFPFDKNAIDYEKVIKTTVDENGIIADDSLLKKNKVNVMERTVSNNTLNELEKSIVELFSSNILENFREIQKRKIDWNGTQKHDSLFKVWRDFTKKCASEQLIQNENPNLLPCNLSNLNEDVSDARNSNGNVSTQNVNADQLQSNSSDSTEEISDARNLKGNVVAQNKNTFDSENDQITKTDQKQIDHRVLSTSNESNKSSLEKESINHVSQHLELQRNVDEESNLQTNEKTFRVIIEGVYPNANSAPKKYPKLIVKKQKELLLLKKTRKKEKQEQKRLAKKSKSSDINPEKNLISTSLNHLKCPKSKTTKDTIKNKNDQLRSIKRKSLKNSLHDIICSL